MKALTISQPYASLIAYGEKWVENRRWATSYRGPLAIHAGKGTQYLDRRELQHYPTGCVIAVVTLADCVSVAEIAEQAMPRMTIQRRYAGRPAVDYYLHEHTEGPWCWILTDVRKLHPPIQYRGAQGLWELPDELLPETTQTESDGA